MTCLCRGEWDWRSDMWCMQNSQVSPAEDRLFQRPLLDLHMMVSLNGMERTLPQWHALLQASGFKLAR